MSMREVSVVEATGQDVAEMAIRAREIDRVEALLQTGMELGEALEWSMDVSTVARAGYYGGTLVCLWGVGMLAPLEQKGTPWLVATPEIEHAVVPFLRGSCYYLNEIKRGFTSLSNVVYDENSAAKLWLKWLGFKMGEIEPIGISRAPFRRFSWEA